MFIISERPDGITTPSGSIRGTPHLGQYFQESKAVWRLIVYLGLILLLFIWVVWLKLGLSDSLQSEGDAQ